jgi:hypothetical protein
MSTRCQVKVTDGEQSLTLYHHTDGYPSHMLPVIKKAWDEHGKEWEGARVYKVASMLCAVDPVVFEPLDYHGLHADIEYYYVINCKDTTRVGTRPDWAVTAYEADFDFGGHKKDDERLHQLGEMKVSQITEERAENLLATEDNAS